METMSQQTSTQTNKKTRNRERIPYSGVGWVGGHYRLSNKNPYSVKVIFFELSVSKVIYGPQTLQTVVIVVS